MGRLGKYELCGELTNKNAGYSMWGFCKKDGKDFFVKQFVTIRYPLDDALFSYERLQRKQQECEQFEKKRTAVYAVLNHHSDGNVVRIEEFFRIESRYYITMKKIEALPWDTAKIASLPQEEIRRLCAIITHAIDSLHKGHIVHADLKHDNILFTKTEKGYTSAKIIDFDGSFLESDPPRSGDDIAGDLLYFSPEACRSIWGEDMELTCKMDIFALGVLFHQYFSGELPGFDTEQSSYPGEAVAKGELLTVSDKIPGDIHALITSMLNPDPTLRPTAIEVFCVLRGIAETEQDLKLYSDDTAVVIPDAEEKPKPEIIPSTTSGNPFYPAGDL